MNLEECIRIITAHYDNVGEEEVLYQIKHHSFPADVALAFSVLKSLLTETLTDKKNNIPPFLGIFIFLNSD